MVECAEGLLRELWSLSEGPRDGERPPEGESHGLVCTMDEEEGVKYTLGMYGVEKTAQAREVQVEALMTLEPGYVSVAVAEPVRT